MTRCQSSSDVSVTAVCGRIAALLTSTSIAPSSASACFAMASTAAASAMSPRTGTARTPALRHSAATPSSSSRLTRVFSTRSAPSAAKASAMARPILRLAPVTNAVFPMSLMHEQYGTVGTLSIYPRRQAVLTWRMPVAIDAAMKTLIEGGWVVAFNGKTHEVHEQGSVVFEDDRIVHAGGAYAGAVDARLSAKGKLVSPGFINTHVHTSGNGGDYL